MPPHHNKSHDPMVIHLKSPGAPREAQPVVSTSPERPPQPPRDIPRGPRKRGRYTKTLITTVAVLALIGGGVYYVSQSHTVISEPMPVRDALPDKKTAASATAPSDVNSVVGQVARHIVLPAGETPTLATVSDLSALSGQEFFKNAAVGDIVLMFAKSRRAILYSPSQDKIIEVAPITSDLQKP